MNNKPIAIGVSDFKEIIETGSLFIDKTLFIKELIDNTSKAICFPRPRRFGKTLNMSMVNYYFNLEYKDNTLFNGLKIMEQGKKYLMEMNKYPVISISFRELKTSTYQDFINEYKKLIGKLYLKYEFLLNSDKVSKSFKKVFEDYYMNTDNLTSAISDLMLMLNRYYGLQVMVLLDEYDAPILYSYEMGYYDEMIIFMKQLFVTTFKDNSNLKKGIITGISRISKENLFSDANNINVYNITDARFSEYFGFTENEVDEALKEYNLSDTKDKVEEWYDGYLFNKTIIYNPWSILKYLENKDHELITYWTNTGGVGLLKNLIYSAKDKTNLLSEFEDILGKGYKEHVNIDLNMDLKSLEGDPNTVWTLFMLSGYLTPTSLVGNGENITLRIPNLEVKKNLINMATSWFTNDFKGNTMVKYLMKEEIEIFKNKLEENGT